MVDQEHLPSALRTIAGSPYNGVDEGSGGKDFRGLDIWTTVTANTGAFSLTVKVQAKSPAGNYVDVPGAVTAAITAPGTTRLTIYPGTTAVANQVIAQPAPDQYRVVATITGAGTNVTFGVQGELLP